MSDEKTEMPELSKIVGLIMENPELVEQISRLGKTDTPTPKKEESTVSAEAPTEAEPASVRISSKSEKRSQLLHALKPYLSDSRAKAVDTMLTFGEIFDMMKLGK